LGPGGRLVPAVLKTRSLKIKAYFSVSMTRFNANL
jgi:hypothetical protein